MGCKGTLQSACTEGGSLRAVLGNWLFTEVRLSFKGNIGQHAYDLAASGQRLKQDTEHTGKRRKSEVSLRHNETLLTKNQKSEITGS